MNNVETVLNIARGWIGLNEADGSHKEILNVYNSYTPLPRNYKVKSTDSWCMAFVSACFIKAGLTNLCPIECSCGSAIELAKNMGIWEENDDIVPTPGMLIMYDWDKKDGWPDHVGIVESVNGNVIEVIEGNKSNAVARRTVTVGSASIRGYVKINYGQSNATVTPVMPNGTPANYKVKVNTPSGVNCRTEPNTNGKKVTAYANGTVLNVTKENSGWLYVNGTGWVSGEYCTKVVATTPTNSSKATDTYEVRVDSALVVRNGPGTNYSRKSKSQLTADGQKHSNANGGLLNGTRVTVSEWSGNWAKIPSGWVSGDYLVKV
ncbi:MAG: SH3 domain-containing protein [Thomasclavelia sp.]